MKKRIWKVIGIVLGSIVGLFGATIGVLAIQGKFSTPVLYPEVLSFDDNHRIILPVLTDAEREAQDEDWRVAYNESISSYYDDNRDLYYFVLTGTNSNEEYPVNRKNCYIWFNDNIGNDLIVLCDGKGDALPKGANNRYAVECNEKIYFKLKSDFAEGHYIDSNENQGLINIRACREDRKVYVEENLSLWIDRRIESIYVDHETSTKSEATQEIEIGLDQSITMDYKVGPSYSIDPIAKEDGKDVELYYVGSSETNYRSDYILVDRNSIEGANKDSELSNLFYYEGDQLMFRANSSAVALGKYYFKIAVFPTYQDRDVYDESHEGAVSNKNRVPEMLFTDLTIKVIPTDVDRVSMRDAGIVLNLFKDTNLSINANADNMSNLNIQMYMNGDTTTPIRYSEIEMNSLCEYNSFRDATFLPVGSSNIEEQIILTELVAGMEKTLSNITIPIGQIIESITIDGKKYTCSNGLAVLTSDSKIKLLESGSYLDVYERDEAGTVSYKSIDATEYFEISDKVVADSNDYAKNYWTIKPKKTFDKNLSIGILVVNGNGVANINKFFATTDVEVQEQAMTYDIKTENIKDLTIRYGQEIEYSEVKVNDIVNVKSGSYDKCLLFVKKSDGEYPIHTVDIGHEEYVLVGYVDGSTFVNAIKVKSAVKDKIDLYIAQIVFEYDQIDYSVERFVNEYLDNAENQVVVKEFSRITSYAPNIRPILDDAVTISDLFNVSYKTSGVDSVDAPGYVYAGSGDHEIILTEKEGYAGLLANFEEFYGQAFATHFSTKNTSNVDITNLLKITGVVISDDKTTLTITYDAYEVAVGARIVWNENKDVDILSNLEIKSSTPERLIYRFKDGDSLAYIELANDANASRPKMSVEMSYTASGYVYTYKYNGKERAPITLNELIGADTSLIGFHDPEYKNVAYPISYNFSNDCVSKNGTSLVINSKGNSTLTVMVGGASFYIDIEVIANVNTANESSFTLAPTNGKNVPKSENGFALNTINGSVSDIITYNYKGDTTINILASIANSVNIENLTIISCGSIGTNMSVPREGDGFVFIDDGKTALTIEDKGAGWTFTRGNEYLYTPMTIRFDVTTPVGKISDIYIEFISSIELNNVNKKNWDIEDGAVNIYKGTKVRLLETIAKDSEFETSAVIKVVSQSEAIGINIYKYDENSREYEKIEDTSSIYDNYVLDTSGLDLGEYKVKIVANTQELTREYKIRIIPNVVIKETVTKAVKTGDGLSAIFTAKAYPALISDATYGSSLVDTKVYNPDSAKIDVALNTLIYQWSNSDLVFSSNIDTIPNSYNLNLNTTGDLAIKVADKVVGIINDINITNSIVITEANNIEISALTPFEDSKIISNLGGLTLDKIFVVDADVNAINEISINGESNKWKFDFIDREYTDYCLKLTFNGDYYYITNKVTLKPFVPSTQNISTYSLSQFNLSGIFTADAADIQDKVTSIKITSINYGGTELVGSLADNKIYIIELQLDGGEIKDVAKFVPCNIVWPEFIEDEMNVVLSYEITYADGKTSYTYDHEIVVKNRVQVDIIYPASDLKDNEVLFKFKSEAEASDYAKEYGLTNLTDTVRSKDFIFEAIPIHNSGSVVLDLLDNSLLGLKRINIDIKNPPLDYQDTSIELVAYGVNGNFDDYANNKVSINNNRITLDSDVGTQGYLLFKITTASGNYEYYTIYVKSITKSTQYIENGSDIDIVPTSTQTLLKQLETRDSTWYEELGFSSQENLYLYSLDDCEYYAKIEGGKPADWSTNYKNYYLHNGSSYEQVTNSNHNGDIYIRLGQYQAINNAIISEVNDFTTLRLAVVYKGTGSDSTSIYCAGVLTVYLKPNVSITSEDEDLIAENEHAGIYSKTIKYDSSGYSSPFVVEPGSYTLTSAVIESANLDGVELTLSDSNLSYNDTSIITIDSSDYKVITEKYVDRDLTFVVKYTYKEKLTLRVVYTYKAIELNIDSVDITIDGYDTDNNNFIDSVDLTNDINLDETDDGEADNYFYLGTISDDSDKFEVDGTSITINRTNAKQEFSAKLTYDNLVSFSGDRDIDINFTVMPKSEQYRNSEEGNIGIDTNPIVAEKQGYTSQTGSQIQVKVEPSGSNNKKFTIGGFDWYVDANYTVEITFSDANYVVPTYNEDDEIYEKTETIILSDDATQYIEFVHLAETKSLQMYVSIKSGDTLVSINTLHIILPQTYAGLEAKYCVNGARYENVVKDDKEEDLFTYMFNSNATRGGRERIGLIDLSGNTIYPNFSNMGFNIPTNPNYITFNVGTLTPIKNVETNRITGVTFTIPHGVEGNDTSIYISNQAGITNLKYSLQLMDNVVDGIDFNGDGTPSTLKVTEDGYEKTRQYVSFLTTTQEQENKTIINVFGKNKKLGTLRDTENTSLFTILGYEITVSKEGYTINSGIIGNKILNEESNIISYHVSITMNKTSDADDIVSYELDIIFDHGEIYIAGDGETEFPFDSLKLSLKLQGATRVLKNDASYSDYLDIVIFNYAISSNYDQGSVDTQYATSIITMDDIIAGLTSEIEDKVTYNIQKTKYELPNGDVVTITDKILEYDNTSKTIILNAIGYYELPKVEIYIDVLLDGYIIDTIVYCVDIIRNLQFVVNTVPDELSDITSIDDSTYVMSTNLLLTSDSANNKFKTITIGANAKDTHVVQDNGNDYYDDLLIYLYPRKEFKTSSEQFAYANVSIKSFYSNEGYSNEECITLSGKTITILKDFSGSIVLNVSIGTNVGEYTKTWTININSMLTFDNNCIDSSYLSNKSGEAYQSNTQVALLSANPMDNGLGVQMTKWGKYHDDMSDDIPDFDVKYDYMIVDYEDAIKMTSISSYYNDVKNASKVITPDNNYIHGDDTATDNEYSTDIETVTLPVVSSTTNYSIVIYEMTISYLGEAKTYYVAYKVANVQKLTLNTNIVNVDEDQYMKTISGKKNYLQLFYFAETFKAENKDWTLSYKLDTTDSLNKLCLSDGTNNYWWNGSIYINGSASYTLEGQSKLIKIGSPTNSEYPISEWKTITERSSKSGETTTYHTAYSYGIGDNNANITKFKTFIEGISKVVLVNGNTEYKFNLLADGQGIWYIDLSSWQGKQNNTYLFTSEQEFRVELRSGDDSVIYSNNLTLTSDNVIEAKNKILLSDIFTENTMTENSTGKDFSELSIIGVASSIDGFLTSWIKTGDVTYTGCSTDPVGIFTIDKVTYSLYEVYYEGAVGNTDIYDSTATFYAILTSDGSNTISIVNYTEIIGGNSTHVYVPYSADNINNNDTTDDTDDDYFTLTGAIIKHVYMDATKGIQSKTISYDGDAIAITLSDLKSDPTDSTYVEKKYVITLSGDSISSIASMNSELTDSDTDKRIIVVRWEKPKA
ncbi:MAG: hypothetical protein ACLRFL_02805 [Clostridia bacterium]